MKKYLLFAFYCFISLSIKAQLSNDDCVNAAPITLDATGNACVTGTTTNAIGTTFTGHPCWPTNQSIPDVWYSFVSTGDNNVVTITPTGGTPAQQVAVTLTNLACGAGGLSTCAISATNGGTATANWTYPVGTTVFVNVGTVVAAGGFQICVSSTTPAPTPASSCATAATLCNKNPFSVTTFPNNTNALSPSCFGGSLQRPVFYQFTVGQSGTCEWTADPTGNVEYDWVMYDITSGCPNNGTAEFGCNFNYGGASGAPVGMQAGSTTSCPIVTGPTSVPREFCPAANVVSGRTYLIIIDNYSDNGTGFNFTWGGTFTIAPTSIFNPSATTTCNPPLNVNFANTSVAAVSQTWNFGNGNTSTAVTPPVQTYTASGTYIVSLTTTSATGCVDVVTSNITIGTPPTVTVPTNTTVCAGATIPAAAFTTVPAGATITWTNSNTAIGLAASGSANIGAFTATNTTSAPITATITVTPTLNGCVGVATPYTITVDPTPTLTAVTSQTVCANANTTAITYTVAPATSTIDWTNSNTAIGLGASGTGDIASFTGTNAGSTAISGNFVATPTFNGCVGTPRNFTVTINPIPSIPAVTSQTVCATANTTAINFNPTPAATTVNWTNSNGTIGVGATGAGNIAAFAGINAGSTSVSGNFIATPTLSGCTGTAQNFTITVNPTPTLAAITSQTICANANTAAITFTPSPATATVNWTNSNGAIGIGTTGTGNIAAFAGINAGSTVVTGNFAATPTENGCTGAAQNFTITVNPIPTIPAITSQTVCANANTTAINFNPTPATATVNWTNSNGTIGVGATGAGNIAAFAGINAGSSPVSGNFVATPTENGCTGTAQNFTITVNHIPSITAVTSQTVCATANTTAINFNPTPATATVNWTNSNGAIGVGTTGTGTIAAFAGINAGSTAATGNFVATPTENGCTGTAQNFTITVNPIPTIPAITSQTVCANANTTAINFNPTPATATVNWTNSNGTIGVGTTGTGNIAVFAGINAGSSPVSGNFVATPTENGCTGTAQNFTITVNHIPSITAVTSQTVCATANTTAINFNPTPATATVNWTNSNGAIGVGTTGTGTIAAFAGINAGSSPVTGNFVATPTENGCTGSAQNFTITINHIPTITTITSQTVCANANTTTVTFNPTPATATVNWTNNNAAIGVGASGTGTIASFTGINAGSTSAIGNFVATPTENGCIGSSQLFSITINPLPVLTAVASQTVCPATNTSTISFVSNPVGATVGWTNSDGNIGIGTVGAGDISPFAGTNNGLTAITGNFVATPVLNTCIGTPITFSITVSPLPIPVVGSNSPICVNTTLNLTASGGTSYAWQGPDNFSSITQNPSLANAALPMAGDYTVTVSLGGTCVSTATVTVIINPLPVVNIGSNSPVCENGTINLTSSGGVSYSWLGPIAFSSNSQNPSLTPATLPMAGNYTVTVTDANNCVNANVTSVIVNPLPIAPTTSPVTYCQNDVPVALTAGTVNGGSLNWYGTNATGGIGSATSPTPSTGTAGNTTYYVSQSLLSCEGPRSSLLVTVNPLPTATLGAVTSGCVPVCRDFTLTPSTTIVNYTWNMGNGTSITTSPNLTNCYNDPGTYSINVTITDNLGCTSPLSFPSWINAYPNPTAIFNYNPQPVTILDPTVTFSNESIGTNIVSYNWNFGDTLNTTASGPLTSFTYLNTGIYIVEFAVMTVNGCVDTIYKPIEVLEEFTIYIPNAFSPNGDDLNEEFYPLGVGISNEKYSFQIFDRWGELIFSTTDVNTRWDGKKMGYESIVQEDTYVYKLSCRSFKGDKFSKSGHVNVIR